MFDNIEFADDRDISTVMDTLVQWCENSRYKNVIMGTGYNEIDYNKFPEAPINHPALSKEEVNILDKDNEYLYKEEEDIEETGTWEGDTYFVQDRDDPYLYSDALDKCVYLKQDGQIPQTVLDQCSEKYGKNTPAPDKQERYGQVDGELHDKYELAALLSDARYELKDKVPNGYRTLLNVGDDGKCTVCLYKGDDTDDKVPFADVARRDDGSLDITMCSEGQGLDGMENDIGDTVEDWDYNR